MGAMSRPTQEEEDDRGWKMLMFLSELSWGVFVIDVEGNERLMAAVLDQEVAMAFAVSMGSQAKHTRIRRLR